uniref:Lipid desaturase domain-containing protein n=1 Tax=Timspurckia oligopyrenoides TaxID=708627 RepID=A0A7S0ZBR6_9RHOD|mmetsp:Transcript_11528/g.20854  ORF Transcript_11528/g.20854 Transcript_11528/m.20854 type:complete len:317 (+) Transcript_11528:411-1361(+)
MILNFVNHGISLKSLSLQRHAFLCTSNGMNRRQSVNISRVSSISMMVQTVEPSTNSTKNKKKGPPPKIHTQGDSLHDEPHHVALCIAVFLCFSVNSIQAGLQAASCVSIHELSLISVALQVSASVLSSLFLADFGTAVYHWAVDNYGDRNTPLVGYQIDAFQGHHTSPWTITERGTFNNLHRACVPVLLPFMMICTIGSELNFNVKLFLGVFLSSIVMCQEIHKWAHMIQSPNGIVEKLQKWNLLVSRKEHGLHHSSPYEGHYGIVNGWSNWMLDQSGFFRILEVFFYKMNGAQPNSWKLDNDVRIDAFKRSKSIL